MIRGSNLQAGSDTRPEHRTFFRAGVPKGFTIIEVLVTVGIVAIVVSFTAPSIQNMRRRSRELLCMTRVSQQQVIVSTYSLGYRGLFPAEYSDRAEFLRTVGEREAYGHYPYTALAEGPLPAFSGLRAGNKSLACPANQFLREGIENRWAVDFSISTAAYLESGYLSPDLPEDQQQTMIARVSTIDDALFPSAKAGVYEAQVWHAWPFRYDPNSQQSVNGLFHWGSEGRISIAFLDGHAAQLFRTEIAPSVPRTRETMSTILNTTPFGMRGRDVDRD